MSAPPTGPLDASEVHRDDTIRGWLALACVVGFFGFTMFVSIWPAKLPGDTLGVIIGYFSGFVSAVLGFYFGSSSGSKAKDR